MLLLSLLLPRFFRIVVMSHDTLSSLVKRCRSVANMQIHGVMSPPKFVARAAHLTSTVRTNRQEYTIPVRIHLGPRTVDAARAAMLLQRRLTWTRGRACLDLRVRARRIAIDARLAARVTSKE